MKEYNDQIQSDLAYEHFTNEMENDELSYHVIHGNYVKCNHVKVLKNDNLLHRIVGDYMGIEFPNLDDFEVQNEIVEVCVSQVSKLLSKLDKLENILVVGLGNKDVIADALGNRTCSQLYVTIQPNDKRNVYVFTPGVKGQTGLDTVEMIDAIVRMCHPDVVIVIDALKTKDIKRLNRVIQITNTGIQPGSGMGHCSASLDKKTLGVDVIAIGVSTVIDVYSIVKQFVNRMDNDVLRQIHDEFNLMVTPKEMDFELYNLSILLAQIIYKSLYRNV